METNGNNSVLFTTIIHLLFLVEYHISPYYEMLHNYIITSYTIVWVSNYLTKQETIILISPIPNFCTVESNCRNRVSVNHSYVILFSLLLAVCIVASGARKRCVETDFANADLTVWRYISYRRFYYLKHCLGRLQRCDNSVTCDSTFVSVTVGRGANNYAIAIAPTVHKF